MSQLEQIQSKLFSDRAEFCRKIREWKAAGEKVVFTNGCFDLLHPGHIDYLARARDLGDRLVIGVNTDASVSKLKGPNRPIQSEESRMTVLAALSFTDALVLFGEETPADLIQECLPDVLVKGGDYTIETIVGADTVLENGGEVKVLPFLPGHSTTSIEQKIKAHSDGE